MSKKVELVDVPVSEQKIDSSIDMKLTKQDLVDLVIEETRERLEIQLNAANEISCAAKAKVDAALKGTDKLFMEALRSKYKKQFAVLKNNGGEVDKPYLEQYYSLTENGLFHQENDREKSPKHFFRVSSSAQVSNKSNHQWDRRRSTDGGNSISISFNAALSRAELTKLYAPIITLVKDFAKAEAVVQDLMVQLRGVDKMGKKAKSQLIKRILEASEDGQALLTNMTAIKASVGQLLLQGSATE